MSACQAEAGPSAAGGLLPLTTRQTPTDPSASLTGTAPVSPGLRYSTCLAHACLHHNTPACTSQCVPTYAIMRSEPGGSSLHSGLPQPSNSPTQSGAQPRTQVPTPRAQASGSTTRRKCLHPGASQKNSSYSYYKYLGATLPTGTKDKGHPGPGSNVTWVRKGRSTACMTALTY